MATILDKIVATKTVEIEQTKANVPIDELERKLADAPPVRDFFAPLAAEGPIKLIAEVKKASPSAGLIRADFDPVKIAKTYVQHGATCISILTDETYFQGSLGYLKAIRAEVELPLLRKDFILVEYQVVEARAAGADAVLLIAECLSPDQLKHLYERTRQLGMSALVELYESENLPSVLASGARLIGINNRDLRSFSTDLYHTINLRPQIPADRIVVGESGIRTREDVVLLESSGVGAMLVGESLMRQPDIGAAVDQLLIDL